VERKDPTGWPFSLTPDCLKENKSNNEITEGSYAGKRILNHVDGMVMGVRTFR
jgi:hypothetical protein